MHIKTFLAKMFLNKQNNLGESNRERLLSKWQKDIVNNKDSYEKWAAKVVITCTRMKNEKNHHVLVQKHLPLFSCYASTLTIKRNLERMQSHYALLESNIFMLSHEGVVAVFIPSLIPDSLWRWCQKLEFALLCFTSPNATVVQRKQLELA